MLSKTRSSRQAASVVPSSPTRTENSLEVLVGEDRAAGTRASNTAASGGSLLAWARSRRDIAAMVSGRTVANETALSRSSDQGFMAARIGTSDHCFFIDGAWKCVGDKCRIQNHRPD
jgi:hypothetical protein